MPAVPKPTKTTKSKSKAGKASGKPSKGVDMDAVAERMRTRKEINDANRALGKSTERQVAKLTGGERTPLSGAVKFSNRNMTGDVEVKDVRGRDFVKIEVKATSAITPSGDKSFSLKKSVLDQMFREAEDAGEVGACYIHWKNADYTQDDYVVLKSKHFLEFLELAKVGSSVVNGTFEFQEKE